MSVRDIGIAINSWRNLSIVLKFTFLTQDAEIPALELGTWKTTVEDCYNAVKTALNNGYNHIDTASVTTMKFLLVRLLMII